MTPFGYLLFCVTLFFSLTTSSSSIPSKLDNESPKNLLFLLPMSSKSHRNVFDPLITAMAQLGHKIVVVSAHLPSKKQENVREMNPTDFGAQMDEIKDPLLMRKEGSSGFIQKVTRKILVACDQLYQNEEFMQLLHSNKEEPFDLVFVNAFWNECTYAFVHQLKAPFIIVSTMAVPPHVAYSVGNRLPPSFVPGFTVPYTDTMTFFERMHNLLTNFLIEAYVGLTYVGKSENIYRTYLGQDVPGLELLTSNASAIFSNSHFTLTYPRPTLPNVIEVGGMHCSGATKPLPNDIEEFVSGAKDGFIYFSLGSIVKSKSMPDHVRKIFVNVFSRLQNYRILWKWETGEMADLPSNVKLLKWAPQKDIMAHKNLKIFITHGGLLSTQEAAYHGVPLVGIPIFADQDLNMKQAERAGNALTLEILELTEQALETTIRRILNEKGFTERAKELSTLLRDQSETALERAVFWSQYILRHKGAYHMRSSARHLNFFQYHSIDVILTIVLALGIVVWILKLVVGAVWKRLCGKKGTEKDKKKRQ